MHEILSHANIYIMKFLNTTPLTVEVRHGKEDSAPTTSLDACTRLSHLIKDDFPLDFSCFTAVELFPSTTYARSMVLPTQHSKRQQGRWAFSKMTTNFNVVYWRPHTFKCQDKCDSSLQHCCSFVIHQMRCNSFSSFKRLYQRFRLC